MKDENNKLEFRGGMFMSLVPVAIFFAFCIILFVVFKAFNMEALAMGGFVALLIGGIFIPQHFYRHGPQRLGIKGPVDIAHAAYPHQLLYEVAVCQLGSQYIFHVFRSPLSGCGSVRR